MKTAALIQARLGSKRLPRKVLLPMKGMPILEIIWMAIQKCRTVDTAFICAPLGDVETMLKHLQVGSSIFSTDVPEDDLAARFLRLCESEKITHFVRICADSPFLHPALADWCMAEHLATGKAVTQLMGMPAGQQPQAYHVESLRRAYPNMTPQQREHCLLSPMPRASVNYKIRLTVDTQEDYDRLKPAYEALPANHWEMTWPDLFKAIRTA